MDSGRGAFVGSLVACVSGLLSNICTSRGCGVGLLGRGVRLVSELL